MTTADWPTYHARLLACCTTEQSERLQAVPALSAGCLSGQREAAQGGGHALARRAPSPANGRHDDDRRHPVTSAGRRSELQDDAGQWKSTLRRLALIFGGPGAECRNSETYWGVLNQRMVVVVFDEIQIRKGKRIRFIAAPFVTCVVNDGAPPLLYTNTFVYIVHYIVISVVSRSACWFCQQ